MNQPTSSTSLQELDVYICDDEFIYRDLITTHIVPQINHPTSLTCHCTSTGEQLLETISPNDCAMCIIDVDLGAGMDGFQLTSTLRSRGFTGLICIHSNMPQQAGEECTRNAGGDLFVTKPIATGTFESLIDQALFVDRPDC